MNVPPSHYGRYHMHFLLRSRSSFSKILESPETLFDLWIDGLQIEIGLENLRGQCHTCEREREKDSFIHSFEPFQAFGRCFQSSSIALPLVFLLLSIDARRNHISHVEHLA